MVDNSYTASIQNLIRNAEGPFRIRILEYCLYKAQCGDIGGLQTVSKKIGSDTWLKNYKGFKAPASHIVDRFKIHFPDLNTDWWLTGEGEMIVKKSDEKESVESSPIPAYYSNELVDALKDQLSFQREQIEFLNQRIRELTEKLTDKQSEK